ncbi:MAG: FIST N-terminal domain-containing protein [Alphaproteobacteria bacterium]|nr:FIST N-terminal domain-containing protein [Alphaproteobacteria bacterium]MDP6829504.1 FIST N-terminal domain-containing protein [Alphaproteobacteria bacterium]
MLEFHSGSSSAVNSKAAIEECIDHALGDRDKADCKLLVIHSTVGHNFAQMAAGAQEACPNAEIIGCTGSGVIGREGVSEAMRAMAVMAVTGDEFAVAAADGLNGSNSAQLGERAAAEMKAENPDVNMIYVLSAGLDLSGDQVIAGIESVFGEEVPIFGATAADNGKAKGTFQFHGQDVLEQGLILVGFSDPGLEVLSGVHHGSIPVEGAVFEVTKSEDNRIIELDGKPAWPALLERFGLPPETTDPSETLPITGLGEALTEDEQTVYDNPQILRVPIKVSDDRQSFYLPTSVPEGTKFQLMQRDEQYIFDGVERLMQRMKDDLEGRRPVAVFHADCMARGRHMFNRVLKDEIIAKMQYPLCGEEVVPWLGVYGYSEYCRFAGKNQFHSYTTSLFPIVRREG